MKERAANQKHLNLSEMLITQEIGMEPVSNS